MRLVEIILKESIITDTNIIGEYVGEDDNYITIKYPLKLKMLLSINPQIRQSNVIINILPFSYTGLIEEIKISKTDILGINYNANEYIIDGNMKLEDVYKQKLEELRAIYAGIQIPKENQIDNIKNPSEQIGFNIMRKQNKEN